MRRVNKHNARHTRRCMRADEGAGEKEATL
jgi:hypothetical protein